MIKSKSNLKIIIIDSLIGNEYSFCLASALRSEIKQIFYIVPKNRVIKDTSGLIVKYWIPSKNPEVTEIIKILQYIFYYFKIFIISLKKTNIIHLQFLRSRLDLLFFRFVSLYKKEIVYTAHNILPHETFKLDLFLYKLIYNSASIIIVHSNFIREKFVRKFPSLKNKVVVVPHGNFNVYLPKNKISKSSAREKIGLKMSDNVIMFFGFIREYKGLDVLLKAFDISAENDNSLKLVICGAPSSIKDRVYYEDLIKALKHKNNIIAHLNFIPNEKIQYYFEAIDLLVLPYKEIDHSGIIHLSYTFAKPVLVPDIGDFSEIVIHNKTGFIIEKNDINTMSLALTSAFSSKILLDEMGKNAKKISETNYSWESIASKTAQIYFNMYDEFTNND